jgi:hypothetical protein
MHKAFGVLLFGGLAVAVLLDAWRSYRTGIAKAAAWIYFNNPAPIDTITRLAEPSRFRRVIAFKLAGVLVLAGLAVATALLPA